MSDQKFSKGKPTQDDLTQQSPGEEELFGVAIVGMAGRFPGAPNLEAYWRNLRDGVESISFFNDDELRAAGIPQELLEHPRYVKAGSVLEDIDQFDARFFGYGPGEASLIDPQQRLLLETAWWALENAGYDAKSFDGPIGVFAGSTLSTYLLHLALHGGSSAGGSPVSAASAGPAFMGNSPDFLATRVAYKLDLQGPAYAVHTACSTSLVAVHLACQALLAYETDVALAGGVSVRVPHESGYLSEESGITSPDGHTRPFDAAGRGTVFGNGVGLVVLRRLEDAVADGDQILAVIRGSATNNDGSVKVGFTAPSLGAQSRVIAEALAAADVDPATVSYVEAHGTGTELGDPIEVAALSRAFGDPAARSAPCALGSVKSNIGHLDAAAGISGLIKTVLMLRHREIPPSLHFETPNPKIDFAASPFEVATERRPWAVEGGPRRAGVSSFGFGGTNVHLVLEEAPQATQRAASDATREQLWVLSARTATALETSTEELADHLLAAEALDPADATYTLQVGRRALPERRAVVAAGREEAAVALRSGQGVTASCERDDPPVIFLFSGQGSQYAAMGRELYEKEPVYRQWIDRAAEAMAPFDLKAVLTEADDEALRRTDRAQPALFAVEHALARLWMSWGIRPAAVLGHSIGEIAAAVIAGHLPFAAAARMVVERGRAMESCDGGAMLAVALSEEDATRRIADTALEIAAVNGPTSVVISGPDDEIDALAGALTAEEIDARRLHTSHAFHSRSMEPAAAALATYLASQDLTSAAPEGDRLPLISNVTGSWIADGETASAKYWARQIRRSVRFGTGLETALSEHNGILLEIGPGNALGSLARRHPAVAAASGSADRPILSSLRHAKRTEGDRVVMLGSLGRLWTAGCRPNWRALHDGEPRRVPLPVYPFERQSYWVGGNAAAIATAVDKPSEMPPPVVAHQRPELTRAFEAPESPAEEALAEVWGELLGVTGVGRHDDFFELGGDSLIATRMLARVQDRLGASVPLDRLFAAPTVAGLAADLPVAGVTPAGDGAEALGIPTVDRDGDLPLSFAQQRLWFLAHLDPTGAAYNLPGTMRLRGALDGERLVAALAAAVERHESLRTRFVGDGGKARQEILPTAVMPFRQVELSAEGDPLERALELAAEDARQPFDLSRAPLGRGLLIRLGPDDHLFQLTLHHIVSDGWSWNVLRRELAQFVATEGAGAFEAPPIQYADFAAWQRGDEGAAHLAEELAFWRERLTPPPPVLDLPTDRPRPAEQSYRGATLGFHLDGERVTALESLGRERGATLFMVLLSIFEVLLSRYSHQRSFAVGTPVANRRRSELEGIVGLFVNSLVLRADLVGEPTFAALLGHAKKDALAAFAHQDLPFERLVDELVEERSLGHSPLFQVMFGLHNTPPAGEIPGLAVEVLEPDTGTAKLDLTMGLLVADDGLEGTLEYSTDLFDRSSVERLIGAFRVLLDGVIAQPSRPVLELPLMTDGERRQVVEEWNRTAHAFPEMAMPQGATLHGLVEAQVERTPEAVALIFEGEEMTFLQFDRRAEALANRLAAAGVGPESRVGIHQERSLHLLVSLLAVLKTGGAWVPLDPEYPPARLTDMVEQAAVSMVLSKVDAEETAQLFGAGVTLMDPAQSSAPPAPPRARIETDPDQLAYVLFTSGSTGRPKGAMNSHRAIINRILWMQDRYGLGVDDRVLQKTPISFDVSVWELFWSLLVGAPMVIAQPGGHRDSSYLVETLVSERVTTLHFVPSMLQAFLEDPEVSRCDAVLRRVVVSGEALPFDLEQRFFEKLPSVELHNLYGPTEAAVDVTSWQCSPVAERRPVAIGRPIHNLRIHLLDPAFRPVPPGVAGELWIGGVGLARGYVDQPALTADRFRPDPVTTTEPGARLYRTGDVARYLPDGAIDYLGRVDHQVKIRGFRIELGEIEAVLADHPAVHEAAVLARTEGPSPRLVAYWTPSEEAQGDEAILRAHLAETLPEHMLPAAFVALDVFPLSPNGKLDRKALPAPDWGSRSAEDSGVPESPAEISLAAIWEDVLGVQDVGPGDNFFRLGGDSITSLQVVARAASAGLALEARTVFQHQTLGALAAAADAAPETVIVAEQGPVVGPLELLPMQRWFLADPPARPEHWNQSVVLELRDPLELEVWNAALEDLVRHHDALRGRFAPEGEGGAGGWTARLAEPFDALPTSIVLDLSGRALEEAQEELHGSLDLAKGPLLASAVYGAASEPRVLLVIHHLAVDGVSWRILLEDLARAYVARRAGQLPNFPPKASSVAAWGEGLAELPPWSEAEREFWETQEEDADSLPADGSEVELDLQVNARILEGFLDGAETANLVGPLADALRARPDEIVLAAVVEAMRRRGDLESLRVDVEGHGRDLSIPGMDVSRTVGWFTALYPLRLDLSNTASRGEAVRRVKAVTRRVPHGGAGYGSRRFLGDGAVPRPASLLFNFLGRLDGLLPAEAPFHPTAEATGPDRAGEGARRYPFEIDAVLFENRLRIAWTYGGEHWRPETVEGLMAETLAVLRELLADPAPEPCLTAAEFPLADLDEEGLERVLRGLPADPSGRSLVPRDLYRLTPVQEGMLFHTLFQVGDDRGGGEAGGDGVFVEQLACELAGALHLDRFREAWAAVQKRHPALRTSFLWEGLDEPLQVVTEAAPVEVALFEGEDEEDFLAADRRRGFDLTRPPLQRWSLLRRADGSYFFVWTFHHLILDGWSAAQVLAEVLEEYSGASGELAPVQPFRRYLEWLADRDGEAEAEFWRQELAGLEAPTPLGIDRAALQESEFSGRGRAEITLPVEFAERLAAAGRNHHLTLATFLQAAWARVLGAYAGQEDVVFGATVAGRPAELPGVEAMVGLFINSLPVRVEIPATGSVADWLTAVQERSVARRPYEHAALGRVQALSALPSGEALFESLLVIENYPFDGALREAGGLALGAPRFLEQTNDPLVLVATPGDGLDLRVGWDRSRIPDDSARRVLDHWRQVLVGLVDALESESASGSDAVHPLELPLLTAEDRHRMLVEWNEPVTGSYDASGLLHEPAERWARETPDEIAVVGDGERMTYGALDALANRLARRLRDLGVGPDVAVGISMERSPRMVAGLLGILKAGGAYVPLDPAYPAERRESILSEAGAPVLVTERSLVEAMEPSTSGAEAVAKAVAKTVPNAVLNTVYVDELEATGEGSSEGFPCPATRNHLAYVIYTSGSTGKPKGVMIPHRGVVNRLAFAPSADQLRPGDRFLHKASLGFDVSVLEIFLPLFVGGRVVMARPGGHQEPAYLAELMRREGVHQAVFTPSLLRLLLEEDDFAACETLHSVASSAESLPPDLLERFHARTGAVLSNRYGPTEASIAASSWRCLRGVSEPRVPIGRPIAEALLYVVDRHLRPLPPGVPGELLIGGPGLARGYLARPGLTADRFVPNPFPVANSSGGDRVYRTGDRVRARADGAFEFLGRLDHQVKVRGFRVEPGEIESALEALDPIRRAVVIDRRDPSGAVRLVAYLEPEETALEAPGAPEPSELRQALGRNLPDYMVPEAFVVLDALPLNASGKVDRKALPDPTFDRSDSGRAYVAPSTAAEEALALVMSEVLGVEQVGLDDDFFELGGDSILSIRVVSKARQVGYELNVRQIFEERTVGKLSAVAGAANPEARAEQGEVTGEVPLTPVMARFFERPIPNPQWFNQALLLDLREDVPAERLEQALTALVEHHDSLRLRFERTDGDWRQRMASVGPESLVFEAIDLTDLTDLDDLDGEAVEERVAERCAAAQRSLDLASGPLVSALHFSGGPNRPARLLLAVHHLAIDGFSWRVLAEDLETACRQLASGEEIRLPLKTASFKAWSERLAAAASRGSFDGERPYWRRQVEGAPREEQDWGTFGEAQGVEVRLDADSTAALVEEVPKAYDTGVDHAVLAAIGGVLQGEQQDVLRVDLEGHGRDALSHAQSHPRPTATAPELDVSRTVGWFTTVYPVTLDLSDVPSPLDRLVRVKETLRRVPSGGAGYGVLRYLAPAVEEGENGLAVAPSPVLFNYLGRVTAEGSLLAPSGEDPGPTRDPAGPRRHELDLEAVIEGDELVMRWRFHPERRSADSVQALAEAARDDLVAMIEACRAPDAGGYTPSDFPDVDLDQEGLDSILAQMGGDFDEIDDLGGER